MTNEPYIALTGSVCSGAMAVFGAVMQTIGDVSLPWDKVSGLGAGGLVLFVTWFFMRRDETVRKEHQEATKTIAANFEATTKDVTAKFAETTTTLMRESREDAKEREEKLVSLFAQFHKDRP